MAVSTKWEAHKSQLGDWVIIQDGDLICRELRHWHKDLILAAVNACKEINPENPQAVADNIVKMHKALKAIMVRVDEGTAIGEALECGPAREALSSVGGK